MESDIITTQFCRKCGTRIPGDSIFCPKCGAKVLCISQETRFDNSPASIERPAFPLVTPQKENTGFLSRMDTGSKVIFFLIITLIPLCIILALVKGFQQKTASNISNPTVLSSMQETISNKDHDDLSSQSTNETTREPYGKPLSGTFSIGSDANWSRYDGPKLTIHASSKDCYVKLKDIERTTVCSFFVRANESVTVGVPRKTLYAYFAEGNDWYGWVDCFGENTIYSKDPQALSFMAYDYEYTMYEVYNGNLTLSSIDEDEF